MPAGLIVLDIDTNIINPMTGNTVTVNGIEISNPLVNNTIIGLNAGQSIVGGPNPTNGTLNTAVGTNAMEALTNGISVTAIGVDAYKAGNGVNDTAIGNKAFIGLNGVTYGNTAVGAAAFFNINTATQGNSGLGLGCGDQLTSGNFNTFVGYVAGGQISSGSYNTTLGARTSGIGVAASGDHNLFLGTNACQQYGGGDGNVVMGSWDSAPPYYNLQTGANNIVIGRNATKATLTASDSITLGNSSNNVLRCAVTSITSLSDARDKKEITELSAGLDFVNTLKPVEFVWDDRNEDGRHDVKDFGFIAQDLKQSQEDTELADTLKLVYEENPEKLEASYGKLIPILVKAIQDLTAKVEALENK